MSSLAGSSSPPAPAADDKHYFYYCDAMGNVGQVVDATSGVLAAQYDYTDPFGGCTASGAWAKAALAQELRVECRRLPGPVDELCEHIGVAECA